MQKIPLCIYLPWTRWKVTHYVHNKLISTVITLQKKPHFHLKVNKIQNNPVLIRVLHLFQLVNQLNKDLIKNKLASQKKYLKCN